MAVPERVQMPSVMAHSERGRAGSEWQVLIIDDDVGFCLLLSRLIEESLGQRYMVVAAHSFEEGLRHLSSRVFDLALVDYRLGLANGVQLVAQALKEGCQTPMVLLTGDDNPVLDQLAFSTGVADFIAKNELSAQLLDRTFRHVLARQRFAEELIKEKRKLEVTLHTVADGVISLDANGHVEYANQVAESLLGASFERIKGKYIFSVMNLLDELTRQSLVAQIEPTLRTQHKLRIGPQVLLQNARGDTFNVECIFSPLQDAQGQLAGRVLAIHDVTELRQWSQKLMFQASHDSLTGLVNRSEFESRLQQSALMCQDGQTTHMLCYIDLDQFKIVNDTCGHSAGDELLRQLAMLLGKVVRSRDTLARLGGDEFGILLWQCGVEAGQRVAEQVLRTIQEFRFSWGGKTFTIGASIGVVLINDQVGSWAEALSVADSACYEAKESGRNRVLLVSHSDSNIARRHDEMQWVTRVVQAVENSDLVLFHQPIADLRGNGGLHYEILVRLRDADGVTYPPGAFLPAAERYNVINLVDRWVVRNVLEWLSTHPEHLRQLQLCSINLSGASISQDDTLVYIKEMLGRSQVPPHKICFEVTETVAVSSLARATRFINELRDFGCQFALDDFGSGMSSFTYLKALPVDFLKIDGSFVRNIAQDSTDYAMVKAINEVGHVTGKRTIAEFCEDARVLACLERIGVDFVQGYHIARPTPLA